MEFSVEGKFNLEVNTNEIDSRIAQIRGLALSRLGDTDKLKACFGSIDLTTLNTTDTKKRGRNFAEKVNSFAVDFPEMPNVAAICVYPTLVSAVKENLNVKGVKVASVAAGFPSSQTFLEIKLAECRMAIEQGADEIDVVIPVGSFLEGDLYYVFNEVKQIKEVAGETHVKVILETGALPSLSDIKLASFLSMEGGADFIKTSTGKLEPAATPEAVYVMCTAIKEFYEKTNRRVGIKPAGGVVSSSEALVYYTIVEQVLGSPWLSPDLFRLGASRLANNLLSDIYGRAVSYF